MPDRRWRHPWQVVHHWPNGAHIVRCSHRYEVTAGWCADRRDWRLTLVGQRADRSYHDIRMTPTSQDTVS